MSNISLAPTLASLRKRYEANLEIALNEAAVYIVNPVGIGEHSDLVTEIEAKIATIADAQDKLAALDRLQKALTPASQESD